MHDWPVFIFITIAYFLGHHRGYRACQKDYETGLDEGYEIDPE